MSSYLFIFGGLKLQCVIILLFWRHLVVQLQTAVSNRGHFLVTPEVGVVIWWNRSTAQQDLANMAIYMEVGSISCNYIYIGSLLQVNIPI